MVESALRVQANQAEQLVIHLVAVWLFAMCVSPLIAAILDLSWVILRYFYMRYYIYRGFDNGIKKITIPCYLINNAMLLGVFIAVIRSFFV